MTGIVSINYPLLLQPFANCKNGLTPDASFYAHAHGALNHCVQFRHREVFRRTNDLGDLFTGDDPGVLWRAYWHSAFGVREIEITGLLGGAYDWRASSPSSGNTVDPTLTIDITKVGGATTTLVTPGPHFAVTPTDAPREWIPFRYTIDVDPNSDYTLTVTSENYARPISLTVRELGHPAVDDAVSYYSEHEPTGLGPIFDGNQQVLLEGTGNMLRKNRGLIAHWCLFSDAATPRTRTSATPINLIDNATTGNPTSTSPGWRFNTVAHPTASSPLNVPIRIAVYGSKPTAGEGYVRLMDTSGVTAAEVEFASDALGWYTGVGGITVGTGQKYDLQFSSDGTNTLTVYAVSVWEEE